MNEEIIVALLKQHNKDAILSVHAGNYEQAAKYFRNSLAIEDQLNLGIHRAETRVNLASTYYLLQDYSQALDMLSEAEQIFQAEKCIEEYQNCQIFKAQVLLCENKIDEAENIIKCLILKARSELVRAKANLILYKIYIAKKSAKALDVLNQSVNIFERVGNVEGLAEALSLRIEFYKNNKKYHLSVLDENKLLSLYEGGLMTY